MCSIRISTQIIIKKKIRNKNKRLLQYKTALFEYSNCPKISNTRTTKDVFAHCSVFSSYRFLEASDLDVPAKRRLLTLLLLLNRLR